MNMHALNFVRQKIEWNKLTEIDKSDIV